MFGKAPRRSAVRKWGCTPALRVTDRRCASSTALSAVLPSSDKPYTFREMTRRAGLLRILFAAGALWIVALHAILLLARIEDGSILRPEVAARWLASIAIVALLGTVARFRRSLRFGRASLVAVWLIAALLHTAVPAGSRLIDTADEWLAIGQNAVLAAVALSLFVAVLGDDRRAPHTSVFVTLPTQRRPLQVIRRLSSPRAPPAL